VVSDDSDRNFDENGPRTGVLVTSKVGVVYRQAAGSWNVLDTLGDVID
jgi:hypothetical protein